MSTATTPNFMLDFHLRAIEGTATRLAGLGADWTEVLAALTEMGVSDEADPIYLAALRGYTDGLAKAVA